jgi:hypothetical protein
MCHSDWKSGEGLPWLSPIFLLLLCRHPKAFMCPTSYMVLGVHLP